VVQRLASALSSSDSYVQIILDSGLPDEVIKAPGSQSSIKRYILSGGFTRYNAFYFSLPPLPLLHQLLSLAPPWKLSSGLESAYQ